MKEFSSMTKIIAIRIRGMIDVAPQVKDTLNNLNLRKKFSCIILDDGPEIIGMLKKAQSRICYGKIDEKTLAELIKKRMKKIPEKEIEGFAKEFIDGKITFEKFNIKPLFNLHPPRGGFKKSTKLLYPRGVLGKNDKINELIARML